MNKTTKTITGFITAAALIAGGGAVTDAQINPYVDKGQTLEIVADSIVPQAGKNQVELIKDRPEIRLKKWGGQVDMGITYSKVDAIGNRVLFTDRMEWKGDKEEVHAYPLEAKAGMEDGGFEIEIILKEKPATNTFEFAIDGWEELDFFYQDIDINTISGPVEQNVIGSYAVYHKTKKDHIIGQTNYATGKVFHIYRPRIIDANNNQIWGELNYQGGILIVVVPQLFLDTATYPVIVDPTLGYTSIGAINNGTYGDNIICINATPTNSGTVTDINVYLDEPSGPADEISIKGAIYLVSSGALISPQSQEGTSVDGAAWNTVSFSPSANITSAAQYVCSWGSDGTGIKSVHQDNGSSGHRIRSLTYGAWPDPIGGSSSTVIKSVYATYIPDSLPNQNIINFE